MWLARQAPVKYFQHLVAWGHPCWLKTSFYTPRCQIGSWVKHLHLLQRIRYLLFWLVHLWSQRASVRYPTYCRNTKLAFLDMKYSQDHEVQVVSTLISDKDHPHSPSIFHICCHSFLHTRIPLRLTSDLNSGCIDTTDMSRDGTM